MRHCQVCGEESGCRQRNWLFRSPRFARLVELLERIYRFEREPQMVPVTAKTPTMWQVTLRSGPGSSVEKPLRKYLWIRRPVHRPAHVRAHHIRQTLEEVKPLPLIVLFVSCVSIAVCLSLFVH